VSRGNILPSKTHFEVLTSEQYFCFCYPPTEMTKLPLSDQRHLEAAEGWIGLGNNKEANEELEMIRPKLRAHPKVLSVRWQIFAQAKNWEACIDISEAIVKMAPELPNGWLERSFALHELKRTEEAHDLLLPVKDTFPDNWTVPYNLACYCSQLGRFKDAEKWFKAAMAIDEETVKREAIDDPDFKPFWDSMGGSVWTKE
jgi:tetratricopeptide (TPR) repeat protein